MAKIILAEDDEDMRAVLVRSLVRAGHSVAAAADGQEALEKITASKFDVLVTDVKMPRLDGVELVKLAVKLRPELRVIFITGFSAVALWLRDNNDGSYPVVSKPFHLKELKGEIARELTKRDAEEVSES